MKKSLMFVMIAVTLIFAGSVVAQNDEYNKGEVFVGYSSHSYPDDDKIYVIGRGVNVSGVYNIKRYVGIKADVSYSIGRQETTDFVPFFDNPTMGRLKYDNRLEIRAATAGVQIKNNSVDKKFKPFGHFLIGAGQVKERVTNITCTTVANCSRIPKSGKQSLAYILGGGLDIKINKRIDIRVFQLDVHAIQDGGGSFRFSSGIIFKF